MRDNFEPEIVHARRLGYSTITLSTHPAPTLVLWGALTGKAEATELAHARATNANSKPRRAWTLRATFLLAYVDIQGGSTAIAAGGH